MLEKQFGLLKGVGGIVYEKHLNHTQCLPPSLFFSEPGVQGQSLAERSPCFCFCVPATLVWQKLLLSFPTPWGLFFFFLKFLAIPYGLRDLSSSTRYQSHTPALEGKNLTTGLPGKCPCSLLMDSSTFPAASICFSQPKGFPHPPELRKVVLSRYRSS